MGGGDLNSKKSWHPNTIKNQERVWKAEKAASEEKKRIQELQMERAQERDRTELNELVKRTAGVAEDNRLHWMYDKPDKKAYDEDYLLGKSIDKNYDKPEKPDDFIPAVARRVVGSSMQASASDTQVDLQRKLREDPLLLVKERERAARAALLNNPLQRKRLTELLRKEQEKKQNKLKKMPKKKEKDLDDKLASKLNALGGGGGGIDLAALLADDDDDTDSSSDSEPSMKKKKKSKKKKSEKTKPKKKEDSGKTKTNTQRNKSTDEDITTSEDDRKPKSVSKSYKNVLHHKSDSRKRRSRSNESRDNFYGIISLQKNIEKNVTERRRNEEGQCSPSPYGRDRYGGDARKRNNSPDQRKKRHASEERLKGKRRDRSEEINNRSVQNESRSRRRSDSEERQRKKRKDRSEERNHRSVQNKSRSTRKNESEERQRDRSKERNPRRVQNESRSRRKSDSKEKQRDRSEERQHRTFKNESTSKKKSEPERKEKKSRLGSEERAAKLAAMMAAGAEREVERGRRVAAQRADAAAADTAAHPRSAGAALRSDARTLPDSLESRIHSNRHYIQRNSTHMNENFARR